MTDGRSAGGSWLSTAIVIGAFLAAAGFFMSYFMSYTEHADQNLADRKEHKMGSEASRIGAQLAASLRSCTAIGLSTIEECANSEGILDQEVAARNGAQKAAAARREFLRWCPGPRKAKDCADLLERAESLALQTAARAP